MAEGEGTRGGGGQRGSGIFAAAHPVGGESLPGPRAQEAASTQGAAAGPDSGIVAGPHPIGGERIPAVAAVVVGEAGAAGPSFVDNGGPVISRVHLQLVFWGGPWMTGTTPTVGATVDAIISILAGPYMSGLSQYRGIGSGTLVGVTVSTTPVGNAAGNPPNPFSNADVEGLLSSLCAAGRVPAPWSDDQLFYCVIVPPGVNSINTGAIGEHTFFSIGGVRAHYAWVMNSGTLPFVTSVFSHELVETVTDPEGSAILGTAGTCSQGGWCEIGDVCTGNTAVINGVTVQRYWSNRDQACIVPTDKLYKDDKDNKESKEAKDKESKDAKDKDRKDAKDGAKDKEGLKDIKDGGKEKEDDGFDQLSALLGSLSWRVDQIGQRVDSIAEEVSRGRAFIRPDERPAVGTQALAESEEGGPES